MAQIGRHFDGRIVALDEALATRRVSGSFAHDDADAALNSVQASVGFPSRRIAGSVVPIGL